MTWFSVLFLVLTILKSTYGANEEQLGVPLDGENGGSVGDLHRHIRSRCLWTTSNWCQQFHLQRPFPAKPQPTFNKSCPNNCNGVGVCNAYLGYCDCPAGSTGVDCSQPLKRPCTNRLGEYRGPGTQPATFIGPDKRDLDLKQPGWTASRCGGVCDDDLAACFCDGDKYGHIPAPAGSPPGTPPIRRGRPLGENCQPKQAADGTANDWGKVPWDHLYGPKGWCTAERPEHNCGCFTDGTGGPYCDEPAEMMCPNQCSGHGDCYLGFCKCHKGWWGTDCASRVTGTKPDPAGEPKKVLRERPWLAGHLPQIPVTEEGSPAEKRRRPLIYVYDTPAIYTGRMLQYRAKRNVCIWRGFNQDNTTQFNHDWLYSTETLIHEMFLASEHRTLDPQEADFFYVPAYTSCFMWPINGWADFPFWHKYGHPRVMHMAVALYELKQWLQQNYPFWDRKQGRDHIFLMSHDEGACWMPTEVYRNAIVLTHWGRTDINHTSNSGYLDDNYNMEFKMPGAGAHVEEGWTHLIQGHPCYTPRKDLVIPALKGPQSYHMSPMLGAPHQKRDILLFFRGDVGKHRLEKYSRGIRQKVYNYTKEFNWTTRYNIHIGDRDDVPGDYSKMLASAKFCLVAPGDGFSARAEDAILHACIPVVVMDGVHTLFETLVEWDLFSIRIVESSLLYLPEILQSIPHEKVERMRSRISTVMHRFAYLQHPLLAQEARSRIKEHHGHVPQPVDWQAVLDAEDIGWMGLEDQHRSGTNQGRALQGHGGGKAQNDTHSIHGMVEIPDEVVDIAAAIEGDLKGLKPYSPGWVKALRRKLSGASDSTPNTIRGRGRTTAAAPKHERYTLAKSDFIDDAFGTIIQWLYGKLQHRDRPNGSGQ